MSVVSLLRREKSHGLGLGWLLAFSLGGAVLLFTCVGLLLSWRIKSRPENEQTTTVYDISDPEGGKKRSGLGFTKRLTKRKYVMARSTSRLSLSPPLMVPMPAYQNFAFFGQGGRKRSRSWVEEDRFHGPKVSKSLRNSWLFKRDSWLGKAPTLPNVMLEDSPPSRPADAEKALQAPTSRVPENAGIRVQRRQDKTSPPPIPQPMEPLQMSEGTPEFEFPSPHEEIPMMPPQIPPQVLVRTTITDSDLNHILRSTELRLREGKSRSPDKMTPRGSPVKASPSKTPGSGKTVTSQESIKTVVTAASVGTVRITRLTTSPSKRATVCTLPQGTQHSRNASISSIGSAAQSLLAEAAQELVLPGGRSSPSKTGRNRQWVLPEPEPEQIDLSEALHIRTKSVESDQSSTLSTLYSVGDQEEKNAEASSAHRRAKNTFDPFVETDATGMPSRNQLFGPRSQRGQQRRMHIAETMRQPASVQSMLRQTAARNQANRGQPMFSVVLDPPSDNHLHEMDYFKSFGKDGIALACPISPLMGSPSLSEPSVTSMLTPSVATSRDSENDSDLIGHSDDERLLRSRMVSHVTPSVRNSVMTSGHPSPITTTVSSTPFDERDMMELLLASSPQLGRSLPEPPRHFVHVDETTMPVPISPRPRRDFSQQLRQMSTESNVSSVYNEESSIDDPSAVSTGSPSRRSTIRSIKSPPVSSAIAVGNSVAELRRMNSMVSSYSVASMASSTFAETESPTLPNLRGGGFSPSQSNSRTHDVGRRNYLSLGTPPVRDSGSGRSRPNTARANRPSPMGVEIREDDNANRGTEAIAYVDFPSSTSALREARRTSGNQGRDSVISEKGTLNPMEDMAVDQPMLGERTVVRDSLIMYDNKGFVRNSANRLNRESAVRALRM